MIHLKPKISLLLMLAPLIVWSTSGAGRETDPSCQRPSIRTATVSKVLANGTLLLESGETVRLIGVMPVKFINNSKKPFTRKLNKLAKNAVELLRRQVEGKKIELAQDGRSHDRYDRLLAHVYGPNKQWLQGALLRAGLARSFSYKDNHMCMKEMLTLEAMARDERLGLWSYRLFLPQQALQQRQLLRKRYRFTLVEGKVQKIAFVKKWVFLNFGDNWRDDFTIAIKRKYKKSIERNGLDLARLAGQRIRVRGWIESWNGPVIKVTHKEQIEVLQDETTTMNSREKRR